MVGVDVLSDALLFMTRKELATLQLINRFFSTVVHSTGRPLHVIEQLEFRRTRYDLVHASSIKGRIARTLQQLSLSSIKRRLSLAGGEKATDLEKWCLSVGRSHYITLQQLTNCLYNIPSYLRFGRVLIADIQGFMTNFHASVARLESTFRDATLVLLIQPDEEESQLAIGHCVQHFLHVVSPIFHLIKGFNLITSYEWATEMGKNPFSTARLLDYFNSTTGNNTSPMEPSCPLNICALPLVRACTFIEIEIPEPTMITLDHLCSWLEEGGDVVRKLCFRSTRQLRLLEMLKQRFANAVAAHSFQVVIFVNKMEDFRQLNKRTMEEMVIEKDFTPTSPWWSEYVLTRRHFNALLEGM